MQSAGGSQFVSMPLRDFDFIEDAARTLGECAMLPETVDQRTQLAPQAPMPCRFGASEGLGERRFERSKACADRLMVGRYPFDVASFPPTHVCLPPRSRETRSSVRAAWHSTAGHRA